MVKLLIMSRRLARYRDTVLAWMLYGRILNSSGSTYCKYEWSTLREAARPPFQVTKYEYYWPV